MNLTILLDLDDTLLNTNLDAFLPAYLQSLAAELTPAIAPETVFQALLAGTRLMNESTDFAHTLEEVFGSVFYPQLNLAKGELDAAIENFYDNIFPSLAGLTSQKPTARPFVDWARGRGYRLAIATDPLLPRKAAHHRLRWAGFEPSEFELISSYEDFHFSKMHAAYYGEILGRLGWPEGAVVMIGNDGARDIIPAQQIGLATYQVDDTAGSESDGGSSPHGDLPGARAWLESTGLDALTPTLHSAEAVLGILSATPAAFQGLTQNLRAAAWSQSKPGDWSLTELICHLRDTEREIHPMQIKSFNSAGEPFIPRPDSSVWASQRDYQHEDGVAALDQFIEARKETIALLGEYSVQDWSRKARHAIFGPTNFLEVVGFMADHDRMHIQQAWGLLHERT